MLPAMAHHNLIQTSYEILLNSFLYLRVWLSNNLNKLLKLPDYSRSFLFMSPVKFRDLNNGQILNLKDNIFNWKDNRFIHACLYKSLKLAKLTKGEEKSLILTQFIKAQGKPIPVFFPDIFTIGVRKQKTFAAK